MCYNYDNAMDHYRLFHLITLFTLYFNSVEITKKGTVKKIYWPIYTE